jgi:hypothetical protein
VRARTRKALIAAAAGLSVAALGYGAYMYAVRKAWIRYNEYDRRAEGRLRVGDLAPDLELALYDGSAARLSSLWGDGKPLFLVFGSCT